MCSSIKCGKVARAEWRESEKAKAAEKLPVAAKVLDLDELAKLDPKEAAFLNRAHLSQLPKKLTGDEATKWSTDKLVELLPEAVASVAYDLRYGTDKVRAEAADKVLRANGLDKREAKEADRGGMIVLNIGNAEGVPWLQRLNTTKIPEGSK